MLVVVVVVVVSLDGALDLVKLGRVVCVRFSLVFPKEACRVGFSYFVCLITRHVRIVFVSVLGQSLYKLVIFFSSCWLLKKYLRLTRQPVHTKEEACSQALEATNWECHKLSFEG
jgi:hypothetical protein